MSTGSPKDWEKAARLTSSRLTGVEADAAVCCKIRCFSDRTLTGTADAGRVQEVPPNSEVRAATKSHRVTVTVSWGGGGVKSSGTPQFTEVVVSSLS